MPHDPHHNHHEGCSHSDDEHLKPGEGTQDFLYSKIDHAHILCLNTHPSHRAKDAIKPWDRRMEEEDDGAAWMESEADEQIIVRIPFLGNIKLRSVYLKPGGGSERPLEVRLFPNEDAMDFDSAPDATPAQTLAIPDTREVIEYPVRASKFSTLKSLTLFFPSNAGADVTKVHFLGFKGEFTSFIKEPVITVYEAVANPADHKKVPGLDGVGHTI